MMFLFSSFKRFLCLISLTCFSTSVLCEQNEPVDYIDVMNRNTTTIDSINNAENISFQEQLFFAFRVIIGEASIESFSELEPEDLQKIKNSQHQGLYAYRAIKILRGACKYLHESDELSINANYLAKLQNDAHTVEIQDRNRIVFDAYQNLSDQGKLYVRKIIENIGDYGSFSITRTNYEAVAQEAPHQFVSAFAKTCPKLEVIYGGRINSGHIGTEVPLTISQEK